MNGFTWQYANSKFNFSKIFGHQNKKKYLKFTHKFSTKFSNLYLSNHKTPNQSLSNYDD